MLHPRLTRNLVLAFASSVVLHLSLLSMPTAQSPGVTHRQVQPLQATLQNAAPRPLEVASPAPSEPLPEPARKTKPNTPSQSAPLETTSKRVYVPVSDVDRLPQPMDSVSLDGMSERHDQRVAFDLLIDEQGSVVEAAVVESTLPEMATRLVQIRVFNTRFLPALREGSPTAVRTRFTLMRTIGVAPRDAEEHAGGH